MGYLIADLAYFIALLCHLGAFLLVFEWLTHALPGAWLNSLRRGLFEILFPILKFSYRFLSFRLESFDSRGLLAAFLLLAIGHYGVPWMVMIGFTMRG